MTASGPTSTGPSAVPLVHVGLPRAGSTSLQRNLLKDLPGIRLAGLNRQPAVSGAVKATWWQRPSAPVRVARGVVLREAAAARDAGRRLVWSQEHFTMGGERRRARLPARARTVRRIFGESEILLVLRDPREVMVSRYRLLTLRIIQGKPAEPPSFEEFVAADLERDSRRGGRAAEVLRFGELAEAYVRQFGESNVHLLLFDDLRRDEVAFYASVCRLIGLDADTARREAERAAALPSRNVTEETDAYGRAVERFPALRLDELHLDAPRAAAAERIILEQSRRLMALGGPDAAARWLHRDLNA